MLKKYRSLRLIFASIMLVAVAVAGLAANFGKIKIFNAIQAQAEEKSTMKNR